MDNFLQFLCCNCGETFRDHGPAIGIKFCKRCHAMARCAVFDSTVVASSREEFEAACAAEEMNGMPVAAADNETLTLYLGAKKVIRHGD